MILGFFPKKRYKSENVTLFFRGLISCQKESFFKVEKKFRISFLNFEPICR